MFSGFLHPCCTCVARRCKGPVEYPDCLSARVRAEVGVALDQFDGDVSHQLLNDLERDAPLSVLGGLLWTQPGDHQKDRGTVEGG